MPYPTVAQSYESKREPKGSITIDFAADGTPHARSFHTKSTYSFTVVHEMVTSTEMQSILNCYASVVSDYVNFIWDGDGATYNCIFQKEPAVHPIPGGLWQVESELVGQNVS